MDKHFIVTFSRQFGSMGRPIAKELAQRLQIKFYDRDIVEQTAKNLGLPVSAIEKSEESARTNFFNMSYPLGIGTSEEQDNIFNEQTKIIRELADKESCIIVGRCSDYILGNEKNCIRIYVYAPYHERLRNCVDMLHMDQESAKKMISKVDKARKAYHIHYAGYVPNDQEHQDVLINSSVLGIYGTARCLEEIIKIRFGIEE